MRVPRAPRLRRPQRRWGQVTALTASAAYAAVRQPSGAWCLTIPGVPPSQNLLDREHWASRRSRVLEITGALTMLRRSYRLGAPVLERVEISVVACYAMRRRRDVANVLGGLKQHVDAIVHAGWAADDDAEHLRWGSVEIVVERPARVEFLLRPWSGGHL